MFFKKEKEKRSTLFPTWFQNFQNSLPQPTFHVSEGTCIFTLYRSKKKKKRKIQMDPIKNKSQVNKKQLP